MKRKRKPRPPAHAQQFIMLMVLILIVIVFGVARISKDSFEQNESPAPDEEQDKEVQKECDNYEPLIGLCNDAEIKTPIAIAMDNHWDARPQAGLDKAHLVYEVIAEFPVTRYLAIYSSPDYLPQKIGPVRSARPFLLSWADELDAIFVHSGGSPEALDIIQNGRYKDLNEFANYAKFYRSSSKFAPHNLYTSGELLSKAIEEKSWEEEAFSFESWKFKDDLDEEVRGDVKKIRIDFKNEAFVVKWEFQKEANVYQRYLAGAVHETDAGVPIVAKNIIAMYVSSEITDNEGRRDTQTIGAGSMQAFIDGYVLEGTWMRPTKKDRLRFYNEKGEEISLNRGITWVEVIFNDFPEVEYE